MKDYWVRREAEERKRGEKGEPVMGGNSRESRFCVCERLRPRKTRPQRCWALISDGGKAGNEFSWSGGAGTLHFMSSLRKERSPNKRPQRSRLLRNTFAAIRADHKSATLKVRSVQSQISASGSAAAAPQGGKSAHVQRISGAAQ